MKCAKGIFGSLILFVSLWSAVGALAQQIDYNDEIESALPDKDKYLEDKIKSAFFPNWGTPTFGFGLGPIAGYTSQVRESGNTRETTHETELGIHGAIKGIPLYPGNPGVYIEPNAGYAWGRSIGEFKLKDLNSKSDIDEKYSRYWVGVDTFIFYNWYRHMIGFTVGKKDYGDSSSFDTHSFSIENDFGVLILPILSMHYTHRYLQAKSSNFSKAFLIENDHWLHGKVMISLLNWSVDFGPGFTTVEEIHNQGSKLEHEVNGRIDYVKMVGHFPLFWKFYASAYAKYVYSATEDNIGASSPNRLADEGLNEASNLPMPEDSLSATELIGISQLFAGFGVGYQMQQRILNFSERNGTTRDRTDNQAFVLTYQLKL